MLQKIFQSLLYPHWTLHVSCSALHRNECHLAELLKGKLKKKTSVSGWDGGKIVRRTAAVFIPPTAPMAKYSCPVCRAFSICWGHLGVRDQVVKTLLDAYHTSSKQDSLRGLFPINLFTWISNHPTVTPVGALLSSMPDVIPLKPNQLVILPFQWLSIALET